LYLAKPLVKLNIKEYLSLDLLNFVSIDDFPLYMKWGNAGVTKKSATSVFCLIFSGFPSHIKLKNSLFRSLNSDCFKFGSKVSK
jgi:hypothetical protein